MIETLVVFLTASITLNVYMLHDTFGKKSA